MIIKDHLPNDMSFIKRELHFSPSSDNVVVYNALLALRLTQFLNLQTLPDSTIRAIADAHREQYGGNVEGDSELARTRIENDIDESAMRFLGKRINLHDRSQISDLLKESGWPAVVSKVTDFVASQEGPEFKINVLDPIERELATIRADLNHHVSAPGVTTSEWNAIKTKAIEIMKNLQTHLNRIRDAADAYFRMDSDAGNLLSKELTDRVASFDLEMALTEMIKMKLYPNNMRQSFREVIERSMSDVLGGWLESFRQGDTPAAAAIRKALDESKMGIEGFLKQASDNSELLKGLSYLPPSLLWAALLAKEKYFFSEPTIPQDEIIENLDEVEARGGWVGNLTTAIRIWWAHRVEPMDYKHYTDMVPNIVTLSKAEASEHATELISAIVGWLHTNIVTTYDTQMAALDVELKERIRQGDKAGGEKLPVLTANAKRAAQFLKQLDEDQNAPSKRLLVLANELELELAEKKINV